MGHTVSRLATLALAASLAASAAAAQGPILMRVSVENPSSHFQAATARRFADLVEARSKGAILVEFRDGARLFRDADVLPALARGDVEVAVPGIWQFDKIVPDTAAFMLPSVYGRSVESLRSLMNGPLGTLVSRRISETLGFEVLGGWLDLGYAHIFSTRPIGGVKELRGVAVRVAGGRGNEERMAALGAKPVAISSADLPAYLDRRAVGAVLTTYETVESAALDTHGLKAVFEDREYYPFYVPLASSSFWAKLSPELRRVVAGAWDESLEAFRDEALQAQSAARASLIGRGMKVVTPTEADIEATRRFLQEREEEMAMHLGVSTEALALLRAALPR